MTLPLAPLGYSAFGSTVAGQSGQTIGTASYFGHIVDGDLGELTEALEDIEFTNSTSPVDANGKAYRQYNPGDTVEGGEYEIVILFDSSKTQVPWGVTETITISLTKRGSSATTPGTISFPGYLKKNATKLQAKGPMTVACTLKVAGIVTRVAPA